MYTRYFDGKQFSVLVAGYVQGNIATECGKRESAGYAKRARSAGKLARVTKSTTGYTVWVRNK